MIRVLLLCSLFCVAFAARDDTSRYYSYLTDKAQSLIPGRRDTHLDTRQSMYFPEQKNIWEKTKEGFGSIFHKMVPSPEESVSPYEHARTKVGYGLEVQQLDRATADHAAEKLQEAGEAIAQNNIIYAAEAANEVSYVLGQAYELAPENTKSTWTQIHENAAETWYKMTGTRREDAKQYGNRKEEAIEKLRLAGEDLVIGNVIGAHDNAADASRLLRDMYQAGSEKERSYWQMAKDTMKASAVTSTFERLLGGGGSSERPSYMQSLGSLSGLSTGDMSSSLWSKTKDLASKALHPLSHRDESMSQRPGLLSKTASTATGALSSAMAGTGRTMSGVSSRIADTYQRVMPRKSEDVSVSGERTIAIEKLNRIEALVWEAIDHVIQARHNLEEASAEISASKSTWERTKDMASRFWYHMK